LSVAPADALCTLGHIICTLCSPCWLVEVLNRGGAQVFDQRGTTELTKSLAIVTSCCLQVLFSLPELSERYVNNAAAIFRSAPANPADDLPSQLSKVRGLLGDWGGTLPAGHTQLS
jgi:hypothetical protein